MMERENANRLAKLLRGEEKGSFNEQLLAEIYSEINQVHQKQDEILRRLDRWQENK